MTTANEPPEDDATLKDVRDWLRPRLDEGVTCPACTQHAQVYRRKLNSGMARSLIAMWRIGKLEYLHLPTYIGAKSREEGKLRYWGLVEEAPIDRPDGGRAGYWRVTESGAEFAGNRIAVLSHARVYNGNSLGLVGRPITIIEALGVRFDYRELMGGGDD